MVLLIKSGMDRLSAVSYSPAELVAVDGAVMFHEGFGKMVASVPAGNKIKVL